MKGGIEREGVVGETRVAENPPAVAILLRFEKLDPVGFKLGVVLQAKIVGPAHAVDFENEGTAVHVAVRIAGRTAFDREVEGARGLVGAAEYGQGNATLTHPR